MGVRFWTLCFKMIVKRKWLKYISGIVVVIIFSLGERSIFSEAKTLRQKTEQSSFFLLCLRKQDLLWIIISLSDSIMYLKSVPFQWIKFAQNILQFGLDQRDLDFKISKFSSWQNFLIVYAFIFLTMDFISNIDFGTMRWWVWFAEMITC